MTSLEAVSWVRGQASYAQVLDVPREIKVPVLDLFSRWRRCNGDSYAVSRMKELYTDMIRYLAGEPVVAKWVRRSSSGLPKGCIGALYRFATRGRREQFCAITLMRVYTLLKADEPTAAQLVKFTSGVTASESPIPKGVVEGVSACAREVVGRVKVGDAKPYWAYQPSPGKFVPSLEGRSYPEDTHWMTQWVDLLLSYYGCTAMTKWKNIFNDVLGSHQLWYDSLGPHGARIDTVGSIGLIQEPGYKLRAVANPNRVYQVALQPLGDCLFDVLKRLPWDCTHDQSKAIPHVQAHLTSGKVVHCVDLSSATDYFPWSLQKEVLQSIVVSPERDYIGLFEFLARAPWRLGKSTIRWSRGQPLGLYPSFASFALTHGLLLYHLNGRKWSHDFFVLGDDVVILADDLHTKYRACLEELGCPVSEAKSLSSSLMGEFAGKLITRSGVFPQPKWRDLSDDNFLDVLRLLGVKALLLCRPKQREVAKALMAVPEVLGGLGFNPKGIPLEERIETAFLLESTEEPEYLMSLDGRMRQYFNPDVMSSGIRPRPTWIGDYRIPDLDQRSVELLTKYLPRFVSWYRIMGKNLGSVPSLPEGVLPRVGGSGRRSTLLTVLRRKLGLT